MGFKGGFQKYFVDDVLPNPQQDVRLHVLDGMRGWAALCVVLFHMFYELFGAIHPEFRAPFSHFLTNGPLAVVVFFILSGQALSISYIQNRNIQSLKRMAVKRYTRLAIPIFASCFIVYVLMKCGLVWNGAAGEIVNRMDTYGGFLQFTPGILSLLQDSLIDSFYTGSDYNFFLWTMKYEFLGSMLVFLLLYFYRFLGCPVLICFMVGFLFIGTSQFISCFFFGMVFSAFYTNGFFTMLKSSRIWQYAGILIIITIMLLDLVFCEHAKRVNGPHVMFAVLLVFIVQTNNFLSRLFEARFSQILGKLSFPVYLVHFAVIVSVASWLIVRLPAAPSFTDALWIGGVGFIVSYIVAFAFLPVETFTSKVGNVIANKLVRR